MTVFENIGINILSDFLFVILVAVFVEFVFQLRKYRRSGRARKFFNISGERKIKIYVSGFKCEGVKTEKVVNALEYESAVEVQRGLEKLGGDGHLNQVLVFLAGLIGREMRFLKPDIEVSPLYEVKEMPYPESATLIVIGGELSNQFSRFLRDKSQFRFEKGLYQERVNGEYTDISPSNNVAIIEKLKIVGQVIFIVQGNGEEETRRAALYLINHWVTLYQKYREEVFATRHFE